jgi:hypothetical protein
MADPARTRNRRIWSQLARAAQPPDVHPRLSGQLRHGQSSREPDRPVDRWSRSGTSSDAHLQLPAGGERDRTGPIWIRLDGPIQRSSRTGNLLPRRRSLHRTGNRPRRQRQHGAVRIHRREMESRHVARSGNSQRSWKRIRLHIAEPDEACLRERGTAAQRDGSQRQRDHGRIQRRPNLEKSKTPPVAPSPTPTTPKASSRAPPIQWAILSNTATKAAT